MVENEWTERVEKDAEEIRVLKSRVAYKDNLIDAVKIALAAREVLIEDTIEELREEKRANLRWEEFAHNAMAEMKRYRDLLTDCGMDPEEIKEKISQGKEL
ncbi:MAG: hypothetical protein RAO92_02040 [Candidatus Euphemobacter frigidus]|nr:hypothetical protein [Candidatus Euphemobacter frigidus]